MSDIVYRVLSISLLNDISNFEGYLMLEPFLLMNESDIV